MHEKGGSGRLPRSGRGAVGGGGYKLFINTASLPPTLLTSRPLPPSPRYKFLHSLRLSNNGLNGADYSQNGAFDCSGFVRLVRALEPLSLTHLVREKESGLLSSPVAPFISRGVVSW